MNICPILGLPISPIFKEEVLPLRWKLALFVLLPLAFSGLQPCAVSSSGSLMDPGELSQYLSPILSQGKGYVAWRLVP